MKTRYPKVEGCVPNPGRALAANALTPHFQRDDVIVELDNGKTVLTGHLCADGRRFNYRKIYGDKEWQYAHITQFSYHDTEGEHQVIEVDPRNPHTIKHDGPTTFAYATKVNGLRWGVTVELNHETGDMQIIGDHGSPIVGALIQLI